MDNTIEKSCFTKVFESKYSWIGKRGRSEYTAYYLIVQDQRAVSSSIAICITNEEVDRIIASKGDTAVISSIAQNLRNGYLYVI
ncbi:MAG: hypothetical protein U0L05_02380 [Schaedlerella sp.]|nr:hypothetical protein [Schaedlerella sp.]